MRGCQTQAATSASAEHYVFILDTNVISELVRPRPEPLVEEWLAQRPARHHYLSVLTLGELSRGVALMPDGRRRSALRVG